jgi:hypothetical protein
MRNHTSTKIAAASLSLGTVLAMGGCKAVQPKPQCKAQPADYAAKYEVVGTPPDGCMPLTAEVLHVQYYRSRPDDPSGVPSIAIEPASVADAIANVDEAGGRDPAVMVDAKIGSEYSQAKFSAVNPDDNNYCYAKTFQQETDIDIPMIVKDDKSCPPEDADHDAVKLKYKWSNLKVRVTPASNAVYFGADLVRTEGDCEITYKVTAVNPATGCGDGTDTPQVVDPKTMMCGDQLGDDGKPVVEDDPFSGMGVQDKCNASIQGTGLNTELTYTCDVNDKGEGSHLCLPNQKFPALAHPLD